MKRFFTRTALAAAVITIMAGTNSAYAGLISGQGSPSDAIPGGTVYNFEATALGTYPSLSYPGFTLSGTDDLGGQLRVSSDYAGQYNGRDSRYVDNGAGGGFQTFVFNFAAPINAFAFLFGASDVNWTLTAYNSSNAVIESHVLSPVGASNAGDYFGVSAAGIASATLTSSNFSNQDWVFVDDVTLAGGPAPVPEPGSALLVALGAAGVIAGRFRRK